MCPLVSIVIPVFNTRGTISTCIDSILAQSNQDFEIIIVDDGSIDGSSEICDYYSQISNKIKVFHIPNGGVSSARNFGLDRATGTWVTFVDSDDYIQPDYLSIDASSISQLLLQNWKVFGGAQMKEEHLNRDFIPEENMSVFCWNHLHWDLFRMVCCKFYLRNIIEEKKIRFIPSVRLGEDTLFMMEYMANVSSIQIIDSSYYMYRRSDQWGGKYELSIKDANVFVSAFYARYKKLSFGCEKLLEFVFDWFFNSIEGRERRGVRFLWFSNWANLTIQHKLLYKHNKKFFFRYLFCLLFSLCNPYNYLKKV